MIHDRPSCACNAFRPAPLTRRELLRQTSTGFGAAALAGLLADWSRGSASRDDRRHAPRAKHVIFLYMDGGPSQVDT
ncbi:MAG: hypothetical protein AAF961_08780, partial [Planctomycetota bacterium]